LYFIFFENFIFWGMEERKKGGGGGGGVAAASGRQSE